jgi:predicted NBD/HSP70 family sugar kinase
MNSSQRYREHTRSQVLAALGEHGAITRPRLVEITGLSRSTISDLVSELLTTGTVHEQAGGERSSGRGRPARTLALTASAGVVAGLDYGHSHIHAALATLDGTVLREARTAQDINDSPKKAVASGVRLLSELCTQESMLLSDVQCVGIGLPAPVDPATGVITGNNILPNWVDLDPVDRFRTALGTPVSLDNDANLGARAELAASDDPRANLIYVKASTGIGSGLVLNGEIYRSTRGIAGELGHIQVPDATNLCRCGSRGCLETVVSLSRIVRDLATVHPEVHDAAALIALLDRSDPAASRLVGDAGRLVGRVLADMCNFLAPDVVVIGGELSVAGPVFLDPIREMIERHTQPMVMRTLEVRASANDGRAEILGAVALACSSLKAPHA